MIDNIYDYLKAWEAPFIPVARAITEFERFQGIFTFGWGFTTYRGIKVKEDDKISLNEAELVIKDKVAVLKIWIKHCLETSKLNLAPIYTCEEEAIVALAYNTGTSKFPNLLKHYLLRQAADAYLEFFDCIYQGGQPLEDLIYRRACDAQFFKEGKYEYRRYLTSAEMTIFLNKNQHNAITMAMLQTKIKIQN